MPDYSDLVFIDDFSLIVPPDDVTAFLDVTSPIATLISPLGGVVGPDAAVTVRVTDNRVLRRVFLWVEYADSSSEMIYRDGAFLPAFATLSTAEQLDDVGRSFEFVIIRGADMGGDWISGWQSHPRIFVGGIDAGGNIS